MKVNIQQKSIEEIDHLAKEKIEVFQADLRPNGTTKTSNFSTIRSLSSHIATDYGERYLLELIQNAYDALCDNGLNQKIKVLYVPEDGEWGALYIANAGRPFQWKNVEAICLIGQSDKPVGQSIGNKGLGFRSVTYISDDPHIFSLFNEGESKEDYGYCFRFARDGDFARWTDDSLVLQHLPSQNPPFCIPFPIDSVPSQVSDLIYEGFVSVVKLPIRSSVAQKSIFEQIELLKNGHAPLLLFLKRLEKLEVIVDGHEELTFNLTRDSREITVHKKSANSAKLTLITLNDDQRYLAAWGSIPEKRVKKAIDESIKQQQLHPSWEQWEGDGELAVAVRIGQKSVKGGLLYTFLPMGEDAKCPFNGYLHGCFYPKTDRTSLHADSPLNSMYIEEALRLSVVAILSLKSIAESKETAALTYIECGMAVVDLLSWEEVSSVKGFSSSKYAEKVRNSFAANGTPLYQLEILPVRSGSEIETWGAPSNVWQWDDTDLKIFTSDRMAKFAGVSILSAEIGEGRCERLKSFLWLCFSAQPFQPVMKTIATVIEKTAKEFKQNNSEDEKWSFFYLDLMKLITRYLYLSDQLQNKEILLCSGNKLRKFFSPPTVVTTKAKKRKRKRSILNVGTTVFSPPARVLKSGTEDQAEQDILTVPSALSNGFAFLSQRLDWYGKLEKVRQLLENHKFVRRYDARELISNVSRIQREAREKNARFQGLEWLFNLYTSRGEHFEGAFAEADIVVPVGKNRWLKAKDAYFSKGWQKVHKVNAILEQFFDSAEPYSQEIQKLNKNLLRPPKSKPFSTDKINEWSKFLELIGVNTGLKPIKLPTKPIASINGLSIQALSARLGINEYSCKLWERAEGDNTYYNKHLLEKGHNIFWFPGQGDFHSFPGETKKLYARLLLEWLGSTQLEFEDLQFEYHHYHFVQKYRYTWSSPCLAFLLEEKWFPLEIMHGVEKGEILKRPCDTWLPEEESIRHKPFMPQIPAVFGIRKCLASERVQEKLVEWCWANVLNDPDTLMAQVDMLGHIFHKKQIEDYSRREFINLYKATWKDISASDETVWPDDKRPDWILTRTKGNYLEYPLSEEAKSEYEGQDYSPKVYVPDNDNELVANLLEELDYPVFDFGSNQRNFITLLKDLLGSAFVGTSSVPVSILADNEEFDAKTIKQVLLVESFPSLPALLCLAMESMSGLAAQQLPSDRGELLARLRRIRLVLTRKISFIIAERPVPLPGHHYGVFGHIDDDGVPYLMFEINGEDVSWSQLREASLALSRLLEQRDLAAPLKLAFSAMERLPAPPQTNFSKQDHLSLFCRELNLNENQASEALAVETGDKHRVERILGPLVHYCSGEEKYKEFKTTWDRIETIDELAAMARPFFDGTSLSFREVYTCARETNSFEYILNRLDLDFAQFNKSLLETGEQPITYPDKHALVFAEYLEENRDKYMFYLREHYLSVFDSLGDLTDFVKHKQEFVTLSPPEDWLSKYPFPPENLMEEMITGWLQTNNINLLDSNYSGLLPWSQIIRNNEKNLKKFIRQNGKIIKTWCIKNDINLGGILWGDYEDNAGDIKATLDKVGALDFRELDDSLLISWLVKTGNWPENMSKTLDLAQLDLTEEDLSAVNMVAVQERLEKEKEYRSVQFGEKLLDPQDIDYEELNEQLREELPKQINKISLGNLADIKRAENPSRKSAGDRKKQKAGSGVGRRLPQEKTELIGFLGECAVFHWLSKRFPKKNIELAWVSKNRERLFCDEGDNSLGYDFELMYKNQKWFLEVKASLQDPMEFEMGETEVEKAKDSVNKTGSEYRIIYVSNVEDPQLMEISVLPNPFSEEGKKVFSRPKEKFRYSWR